MKHALTRKEIIDKGYGIALNLPEDELFVRLSIIDKIQADAEQEFKLEAIKWKSIGESFDLNDIL